MTAGAIWLASLGLLPGAGAPLLAHPSFRRFSFATRAVLAGGVGAALVSFAMTVFTLAGVRWNVAVVTAAAALLAGALRLLLDREPDACPLAPVPAGRADVLAAGLAAVSVLAAFVATRAGAATSVDLVFFWGPKAEQFAAAHGVDTGYLREAYRQYMHPYYPPLVANLFAFASMTAGRFSWTAATWTFPLLLGALAIGLPGVLRAATPRTTALAASSLAVAALASLGILADIGGNGDMPLLFFETLAIALLLRPDSAGKSGELLAGLLLAGAATAKVEGLPFALAAAALYLVLRKGSASSRAWAGLRLLAPTAIALCAWFAFSLTRRLFSEYSEYGALFDIHPEHGSSIAAAIPRALYATGHGLPWLVPLLCLVAAGRLSRRAVLPLGVAAALAAFLVFTYLHLAEDPAQWIAWSANRVLAPVPVLFALAACGPRPADAGALSS
jgi:hypothetical protein